jgi:hypothetical protein
MKDGGLQFVQASSGAARRELASLANESDPELFFESLLAFGFRQESADREALAAQAYQAILQKADSFPEIAARARRRLDAMEGRGSFGSRFELLFRHLARDSFSPSMLIGMAGAQAVFGLARAGFLARLLASPISHDLTRGSGAQALAAIGAFALEAPSFVAFTHGARAAFGAKQDGTNDGLGRELASSYLSLGALKLGGSVFGSALGSMGRGRAFLRQAGMFSGILLGHGLEQGIGLRAKSDGPSLLADSLAMLIQFNLSGKLLSAGLGSRWVAFNRELQLRSLSPIAERSKDNSMMSWATEGSPSPLS